MRWLIWAFSSEYVLSIFLHTFLQVLSLWLFTQSKVQMRRLIWAFSSEYVPSIFLHTSVLELSLMVISMVVYAQYRFRSVGSWAFSSEYVLFIFLHSFLQVMSLMIISMVVYAQNRFRWGGSYELSHLNMCCLYFYIHLSRCLVWWLFLWLFTHSKVQMRRLIWAFSSEYVLSIFLHTSVLVLSLMVISIVVYAQYRFRWGGS